MDENIRKLKSAGLKVTPQRLAIMEFFEGNRSHPSINSVYESLKKSHPSISVSTVYNTVEALVKNSYLTELPIVKGMSFYDPDMSDHDHAYCIECGRITDISREGVNTETVYPEALKGCSVLSVRRNYYIICSSCGGNCKT